MRAKALSSPPPKGGRYGEHPPVSPARPSRCTHNDLLQIILEEGVQTRNPYQEQGPIPPWPPHISVEPAEQGHYWSSHPVWDNNLSHPALPREIRVAICCTLQTSATEAFTHDLFKLLARCRPRANSLKHALERIFLTNTELFNSPLNCSMTSGITHCSAFPEDDIFGAITDSFLFRWTSSCITNPVYELEEYELEVLHALASS